MAHDLIVIAREIAEDAHEGQTDKSGQPYLGHVERVAAGFTDPADIAVALLHDVIEDTDWTADDLYRHLPADIVDDVVRLTHARHEPRADYYARVRESDRAVRVKLADVADNSDPARLAVLDAETRDRLAVKYAKARAALAGVAVQED